jgi:hypothetical protein
LINRLTGVWPDIGSRFATVKLVHHSGDLSQMSSPYLKDPAVRSSAARGTVHEETEVRRVLLLADTKRAAKGGFTKDDGIGTTLP